MSVGEHQLAQYVEAALTSTQGFETDALKEAGAEPWSENDYPREVISETTDEGRAKIIVVTGNNEVFTLTVRKDS